MHSTRAPVLIALGALLLATLALPAHAQSGASSSKPPDTPNFLENWSKAPDGALPDTSPRPAKTAPATPEKPAVRAPASRAPDPEAPSASVDVGETGASEAEKSKTAPRNTVVEPYPQNPRCYVAGRYVPAPPLCPN